MYNWFILLLAASVLAFDDSTFPKCGYPYNATVTFRVDKVYPPPTPLLFGLPAYNEFISLLKLTPTQIDDLRIGAYKWYAKRFGIPAGTYNATTTVTTIPGVGIITPVIFTPDYDLISANPVHLAIGCPRLLTAEFTFISDDSAAGVFIYGGEYGRLYPNSTVKAGDALSFGFYLVSIIVHPNGERAYVRKIIFKSKYPTRYLNPITPVNAVQVYVQESYLEDKDLGQGLSKLQIRLDDLKDGSLLADVTTILIFSPLINPDDYAPGASTSVGRKIIKSYTF
jgi:hypothetical protein